MQADGTWRYAQKALSVSFERDGNSVDLSGACKKDDGQNEYICNKSLFQKALIFWVENMTNAHISVKRQSKVLHRIWSSGHNT